ncbi:MAG: hypothetical protein JEZ14_25330 [Marinilabiliaceae bacterium]|nr:hypothetical protein [Marinilabiliaceae bacterium]
MFLDDNKTEPATGVGWLDSTLSVLDKASKALKPIMNLDKNLEWWEKADYYKNRGLYVDFKDHLLLPEDITEGECDLSREIVKKLLERIIAIIA